MAKAFAERKFECCVDDMVIQVHTRPVTNGGDKIVGSNVALTIGGVRDEHGYFLDDGSIREHYADAARFITDAIDKRAEALDAGKQEVESLGTVEHVYAPKPLRLRERFPWKHPPDLFDEVVKEIEAIRPRAEALVKQDRLAFAEVHRLEAAQNGHPDRARGVLHVLEEHGIKAGATLTQKPLDELARGVVHLQERLERMERLRIGAGTNGQSPAPGNGPNR